MAALTARTTQGASFSAFAFHPLPDKIRSIQTEKERKYYDFCLSLLCHPKKRLSLGQQGQNLLFQELYVSLRVFDAFCLVLQQLMHGPWCIDKIDHGEPLDARYESLLRSLQLSKEIIIELTRNDAISLLLGFSSSILNLSAKIFSEPLSTLESTHGRLVYQSIGKVNLFMERDGRKEIGKE